GDSPRRADHAACRNGVRRLRRSAMLRVGPGRAAGSCGWAGRPHGSEEGSGMGGFFTGRTLADIARSLRSGAETPAGLLAGALESVDPDLNAFVTVDPDGAAAAAER